MRPVSERTGAWELLVEVELRRGHMRRSLRDALRLAIQDGRLAAHTVLPSSRRLASGLGVSRGVVTDAYDQLVSEGYLEVRQRFAPEVAAIVGTTPAATEAITPTPRFDLDAVTPDVRLFPRRAWIRAVERALRNAPDSALDYGDHAGRIELRSPDGHGAVLDGGRLLATGTLLDPPPADADDIDLPLPRHLADELACVGTWLDAEAGRLRLVHCDGELASPLPRLPRFEPRRGQERSSPGRAALSAGVV